VMATPGVLSGLEEEERGKKGGRGRAEGKGCSAGENFLRREKRKKEKRKEEKKGLGTIKRKQSPENQ